jgi:hypothetical protein
MFKSLFIATLLFTASPMAIAMPVGPTPCELCEFVVSSSQNFLAAKHTTDELQLFFNYTCDLFGIYSPICHGAVSSFVPKLISTLSREEFSDYSAEEICAELNICVDYDIVVPPIIVNCTEVEFQDTQYCISLRTSHDVECSPESMVISELCKNKPMPEPIAPTKLFVDINHWDPVFEDILNV